MKKLTLTMLAAALCSAAFAQNPDAVKQALAATKYSEASAVLKEQGESMISEEKAKVYNKLVDLGIADNAKAEEAAVKAQLNKDEEAIKAQSVKKVKGAYNALSAGIKCNKFDNEPNAKGQVKPKFKSKNAGRLIGMRNQLVDGGLDAYNSRQYADAQKYFGLYVESRHDQLFDKTDFTAYDQQYGAICYYASLAAYFNKDYKKAVKYVDYAIEKRDSATFDDAIKLKLNAMEEMAKAGEIDSTKLVKEIKKFYNEYPDNQAVFSKYIDALQNAGQKEEAEKVLAARIAANPNDLMANAYVGQNAQDAGKFADAIAAYTKVLEAKPDFLAVRFNLGVCYLNRANDSLNSNMNNAGVVAPAAKPAIVEDLNAAKKILEEVKAADPDCAQVNWAYTMQRVDYILGNIK